MRATVSEGVCASMRVTVSVGCECKGEYEVDCEGVGM